MNPTKFTNRARLMLFALILGLLTHEITTIQIAMIRDLDFQLPYFEQQVETWTASELASLTPSSVITTSCNTEPLLGGPDIFDESGGTLETTYTGLMSHSSVFITFNLTVIDTWSSSSQLIFKVNGVSVAVFDFYSLTFPSNLCGDSSESDLSIKVFIAAATSSTDLTIEIARVVGTFFRWTVWNKGC